MTMWTETSFASEAKALIGDNARRIDSSSLYDDDDFLSDWELNEKEGLSELTTSFIRVDRSCSDGNSDSPDHDGNILQDDHVVVIPQRNDSDEMELCWRLSIVYRDTWQCPVLYFRVEHLYGSLVLSHESVIEMLRRHHHQNHVEDPWEFVSLDEHPIHNTPFFFLHPCQTEARLRLLTTNRQKETNPPGALLLSWMSMILPSIGMSINARTFASIRLRLFDRNGVSSDALVLSQSEESKNT